MKNTNAFRIWRAGLSGIMVLIAAASLTSCVTTAEQSWQPGGDAEPSSLVSMGVDGRVDYTESLIKGKEETVLSDFVYEGEDLIEKLVYESEIEYFRGNSSDGFVIVAPKIFGQYKEGDRLKIFATTAYGRYQLYGNVLVENSCGVFPKALTYVKQVDGSYRLEKREEAKDGNLYLPSIRDFCTRPVSGDAIEGLADQMIAYQSGKAVDMRYQNLAEHLKANHQANAALYSETGETLFSLQDYK